LKTNRRGGREEEKEIKALFFQPPAKNEKKRLKIKRRERNRQGTGQNLVRYGRAKRVARAQRKNHDLFCLVIYL